MVFGSPYRRFPAAPVRQEPAASEVLSWDRESRKWMLGSLFYAAFWVVLVSRAPEGSAPYYVFTSLLVLTLTYGVGQVLNGRHTVAAMILSFMAGSELLFRVFVPYNRYSFLSYFTVACGLAVFIRSLLSSRLLPKGSGATQKFFVGYALVSALTLVFTTDLFLGTYFQMAILSGLSIMLLLTDFRPNYTQTMRLLSAFCLGQLSFGLTCFYFWSVEGRGGARLSLPGKGSNEVGMLIGASFVAYLILYYHARSFISRALIVIPTSITLLTLYLTQTRGAIVAIGVSTLIIVLLTSAGSIKRLLASIVVVAMLALTLVVAEEQSEGRLSHRFEKVGGGALGGRTKVWIPALHETLKRPFLGHGLGSFSKEIDKFLHIGGKSAHNELIRVGFETGFLGAFLFLGWHFAIFTTLMAGFRRDRLFPMRMALFSYVVVSGMSISYRSRWTYLFFAISLLGWFSLKRQAKEEARRNTLPSNSRPRLTAESAFGRTRTK